MWVKITSLQQIESLHPGALIAIHPLQGPPRESFDDSDTDQVSQRLVAENDSDAKILYTTALQRKEEAHTITSASMGNMILGSGEVAYTDIIEHGVWWMQQGR